MTEIKATVATVLPSFAGWFYDGKTSKRDAVALTASSSGIVVQGPHWQRSLALSEVKPIDARNSGPLFMQLLDGSTFELASSALLQACLREAGVAVKKGSAIAAFWHADWRLAVMATAFLASVIAAFYLWLLPAAVGFVVPFIPDSLQQRLGQAAMRQMDDDGSMQPSRLPEGQQAAIQQRFAELVGALDKSEQSGFELHIRKSPRIGPNAFALPGTMLVLTDELVTLVDGDLDTISGVLAHELGHVHYVHGLRGLIQASALFILGSAVIGDYSSILAVIPATLGGLRYSRSFELEADVYAHELLCKQGLDPAKTAKFFDKLSTIKGNVEGYIPGYLLTHPASSGRAQFFRKAC